jgi:hypothetical protein
MTSVQPRGNTRVSIPFSRRRMADRMLTGRTVGFGLEADAQDIYSAASTLRSSSSRSRLRLVQKGQHPVHDGGVIEPWPVAGVGHALERGARKRSCVGVGERGLEPRVALAPDHQRGNVQLCDRGPRGSQPRWIDRAVQTEDRALGALIKLLPDRVDAVF